jgi:C-lobe and N-lobe beta barrels of Tf-binding protein B
MITNQHVKLATALFSTVFVAACGGGGGGSAPAASVAAASATNTSTTTSTTTTTTTTPTTTTTTTTPTTTTVVAAAASPKALMVYVPASAATAAQSVSLATMPTSAGSSVTVTGPGTIASATVTGNLGGGQTSTTTGTTPMACSTSGRVCSGGVGDNLLVQSVEAGSAALAYSSYGMLLTPVGTAGAVNIGAYHTGTPTAVSSLPTNVTATYTGGYIGYEIGGAAGLDVQAGRADLTANFGAGTVTGKVTNLTNLSTSTSAGYGLSMNGAISGGAYTGTAGFTNTAGTAAAGTVTSSALNGGFYGPGAVETAGALSIRGTAPTASPTVIVGSFGAKKN